MSWSPDSWLVESVGAIGAILTTVCWLPQAAKTLRERETRAISLVATAAFTLGMLFWLIYGIALVNWPLIGSAAIEFALMLVILSLKLKHG
jgi:MtN3 and saliva related transmembrane protein